jgi:hypothetical protein
LVRGLRLPAQKYTGGVRVRNIKAEEVLARKHRRVGEFLERLSYGGGAKGVPGGTVTRITIRLPTDDQPEVFVVVKVAGDEGDFVGFVGALDVVQALLTWMAKDASKGLKWRPDVPWAERAGGGQGQA